MLRRGRQTYGKKYDEAIKLHTDGKSINQIAQQLDISYSAAYHWIKGIRTPAAGNLNEFEKYLKEKGPMPQADVVKTFPKHNEMFLMANKRSMNIRRKILKRKYGQYAVWYYLDGQEAQLEERLKQLFERVEDARSKLRDLLFK